MHSRNTIKCYLFTNSISIIGKYLIRGNSDNNIWEINCYKDNLNK